MLTREMVEKCSVYYHLHDRNREGKAVAVKRISQVKDRQLKQATVTFSFDIEALDESDGAEYQTHPRLTDNEAIFWSVIDPTTARSAEEDEFIINQKLAVESSWDPVLYAPDIRFGEMGLWAYQVILDREEEEDSVPQIHVHNLKLVEATLDDDLATVDGASRYTRLPTMPPKLYRYINYGKDVSYFARPNDPNTAEMIRQAMYGKLPLEILADCVEEAEPPETRGQELVLKALRESTSKNRFFKI